MRKYKYILCIMLTAFILVGCSKTKSDVKASDEVNEPKSAKEVLEKTVDFYKKQQLKSLVMNAKSTIVSNNNSQNKVEVATNFVHIFEGDTIDIRNSKLDFKTLYKKKLFGIELHFFKDGSVGYAFSNAKDVIYDASDVSQMIGVRQYIPACTNVIEEDEEITEQDEESIEEPSEEPIQEVEETVEPTATATPSKTYKLEDLLKLSERLKLKGGHANNEIVNGINAMIDGNLYNLPNKYGNIYYNLYVDKETFEIISMDIDISEVVQTLCKSSEKVDNIIKVNFSINTVNELKEVNVKKAGLTNFSNVWTAINYYSKVMAGLTADA